MKAEREEEPWLSIGSGVECRQGGRHRPAPACRHRGHSSTSDEPAQSGLEWSGRLALMIVLALDTTTRPGSVAIVDRHRLLALVSGGDERPHAERLPGDIATVLADARLSLGAINLLAVAAGPGSFTGLRIGIAAIQGLAFASSKPVLAVSALDALALVASRAARVADGAAAGRWCGAWMNAHRGEVFSALYFDGGGPAGSGPDETTVSVPAPVPRGEASVGDPAETAAAWSEIVGGSTIWLAGDGADVYRNRLEASRLDCRIVVPPPLAPVVADVAAVRFRVDGQVAPHAIRPVYVRRPDAELARDRANHAGAGGKTTGAPR